MTPCFYASDNPGESMLVEAVPGPQTLVKPWPPKPPKNAQKHVVSYLRGPGAETMIMQEPRY